MHLDVATADAWPIEVELHTGMIRQKRHGDGGISNFVRDHPGCEALAKGIVVRAGVPDRDLFGAPGFQRTDADRLCRYERNVAPARSARVLRDS